jgi:GNAT superfamily N-acetyltransferase
LAIAIRPAEDGDIPAMAATRAQEWGTESYWAVRISGYLDGSLSPQHALPERAALVAVDDGAVVGFAAGHRTRRYGCDGELEWINIAREHRARGIAAELLSKVGAWFVERDALRVCVDVEPGNAVARRFYTKHGAVPLNAHWMVWEDARLMGDSAQRSTHPA